MSNKNDEVTGFLLVFAFVGAMLTMFIVVIYAIAVVLSAALTILAFLTWNKPKETGDGVLTSEQARFFVGAGLVGAVSLPFFIGLCSGLLQMHVPDEYFIHIVLAGYAFGSIGLTILAAKDGVFDSAPPAKPLSPPIDAEKHDLPGPEYWNVPASPPSFHYATWDDEESGR